MFSNFKNQFNQLHFSLFFNYLSNYFSNESSDLNKLGIKAQIQHDNASIWKTSKK